MNSWLLSWAFLAVHPETFASFDFHSSRSSYAPLNFCILSYSSLLFCFSPLSKFINNIKLSSPPSSLASKSSLSALLSVQHYTALLCSSCSWAINSFTDEKGNKAKPTIYVPDFYGIISHIQSTRSQLPIKCEIPDAVPQNIKYQLSASDSSTESRSLLPALISCTFHSIHYFGYDSTNFSSLSHTFPLTLPLPTLI